MLRMIPEFEKRTAVRIPTTQWEKIDCLLQTGKYKARGEDISSFIRRSVKKEFAALGYLSADEMKALGVKPQEAYS